MDAALSRLADQFASAAVDNSLWLPALASLADATRSERGQLIGIGSTATVPFNWVTGFPESALQHFVDIDGGSPHINPRVAVSIGAPILGLRAEKDYRAATATLTTDIYADFARQYEISYGCQTKLTENSDGIVGLAVLRTERDGLTSAADRAVFASVAPFVRSAVRTQIALQNAGPQLIAGAFEAVESAVFVCGAQGIIAAMTSLAERLLHEGPLRLVERRLTLSNSRGAGILRDAIARHCDGISRPMETLILDVGPGSLPLLIDICPAPRGTWHFSFSPQILVIVRTGQRVHSQAPQILKHLYRLSAAEADVALRLARGESRSTIAAERDASLETVRAQLKSAFAKLGVNREVELVSMLARTLQL